MIKVIIKEVHYGDFAYLPKAEPIVRHKIIEIESKELEDLLRLNDLINKEYTHRWVVEVSCVDEKN